MMPALSRIPGGGSGPNMGKKVAAESTSPSVIGVPVNESSMLRVGLFQSTENVTICAEEALASARTAAAGNAQRAEGNRWIMVGSPVEDRVRTRRTICRM